MLISTKLRQKCRHRQFACCQFHSDSSTCDSCELDITHYTVVVVVVVIVVVVVAVVVVIVVVVVPYRFCAVRLVVCHKSCVLN